MAMGMRVIPFVPSLGLRQGQPRNQNLNFRNKHSSKLTCCSHGSSSDLYVSPRLAVQQFNPNIPVEEAVTPPTSWYTDPTFFHLELDRVFYRGWQAVGQFYSALSFILFVLLFLGILVLLSRSFLLINITEGNKLNMQNFNPIVDFICREEEIIGLFLWCIYVVWLNYFGIRRLIVWLWIFVVRLFDGQKFSILAQFCLPGSTGQIKAPHDFFTGRWIFCFSNILYDSYTFSI